MTNLTFALDMIKIILLLVLPFSKPFLTNPVVYSVTAVVALIDTKLTYS